MSILAGCVARGCAQEIALADLMCVRHWVMIPSSLQAEIRETCAAWINRRGHRKPYDLAVARAVLIIAEKEDQPGEVLQILNAAVARLEDLQ